MKGRLPDFLIIGGMKCGTTSLYDYLSLHPDIHMTSPKELHFFSLRKFNPEGLATYKEHFESDKKVAGSVPQNYTKRHVTEFSGAPGRLYRYCPDIKLIYIVRDPLDRIYSHYNESQENVKGADSLLASVQDLDSSHFVQTSRYYYQLSAFLEYFPPEQMLIVATEALHHNRLTTLNQIFEFLHVDKVEDEALFSFVSNQSANKRRITFLGRWMYGPRGAAVRRLIPNQIKNRLSKSAAFQSAIRAPLKKEQLPPEVETAIKDYLRPDVEQLRAFSKNSLSEWDI